LGFLSHVDTVLADPADWTHDPWSGEIHDGFVWGRGAIDMKSQTAAEVAAAVELASGGWRPARGALKVIVVADEETGGSLGARWLVERGVRGVGIDHYSIGGSGPLNAETHTILLGAGVWVVEELKFPEEVFALPSPQKFWALPLNWPGCSGAFCRPVLEVE
jgi:acetylornithine deacetylase/succinyl-diaminopimelate desuccinylase-like protein